MDSNIKKKIQISFKQSLLLLVPYCKSRLFEQIRSVLPVIVYLVIFQKFILGMPISDSSIIAGGMFLVILGLTFFMEGLLLGIMPLGEIIGVKLPIKSGLFTLIVFSFILGLGATLAEPSISILKAAGSFVKPWDAPLLFLLLNKYSGFLVMAVGIGVGIAVIAGMLRFMYGISLKVFIYSIIPILLGISFWGCFDKNIYYLTGLAWDCGAVTTGPVTVPLVLALGIGICRSLGNEDNGSMGFGVVTLASAFPILSVLILGLFVSAKVPQPMSKEQFFKDANRSNAVYVAGSEEELDRLLSFYNESLDKKEFVSEKLDAIKVSVKSFVMSAQAILPLTLFLLIVFLFVLRERLIKKDEIFFGIFIAIIGMGLFNLGIEFGLAKMGTQVGLRLPSSFTTIDLKENIEIIDNFDPDAILYKSIDKEGLTTKFFYQNRKNDFLKIAYDEKSYDSLSKKYIHIPKKGPLFGKNGGIQGFIVVLLFAFIMGYGATLAEPALNALGIKVEELTIGTFKKSLLIQSVAVGVGVGIAVGAAKIIWDISLIWLLAPPYIILLFLTKFSSEEYVNIGWDSAGVTTGPVTVPLVLAMGLGIGNQIGVVEGFGILSLASVYPILGVLFVGFYASRKSKNLLLSNPDKDREQK